MTLPDERYRAVIAAERLLKDLCDPSVTPRVPKTIRARASSVLRHYPGGWDMQRAAHACPDVFQEQMEPLYRMIKQRTLEQNPETTNTLGDQT
jgi:hypothetical protein